MRMQMEEFEDNDGSEMASSIGGGSTQMDQLNS